MSSPQALILVVDDDPLTCRMVEFLLQSQNYDALIANSPQEALTVIHGKEPDLVLLDVQLPKTDGFTLLRHLRKEVPGLPVIMLTARAEMQDRLTGFESGADDYVVKPFEPAELLARIKAVLNRYRRKTMGSNDAVVQANDLKLDVPSLSVTLADGTPVSLTPTETRVLHRLMTNSDRVVTRDDLASFAMGYDTDISNNQIDVYIGRIRKKLQDDINDPRYILTIRGRGYKFISRER